MARLAMLGTGMIGSGMVTAWRAQGHEVQVWNRSLEKARALSALGATVFESAARAAQGVERVHVALRDDAAVDEVLSCARTALHSAIVVDHSTTSPTKTRERAERFATENIRFLHAPVFMSPAMCRESKGLMVVSGAPAVFSACSDGLRAMTGDLWYAGAAPELAAKFKLLGNALIIAIVAGVADVYGLAKAMDMGAQAVPELFGKFNFGNVLAVRGARMAQGDYAPSFELSMARKDVGLMLEAGGADLLAVLPAIAARMDVLITRGNGGRDLAVLAVDAVPEAARKHEDTER